LKAGRLIVSLVGLVALALAYYTGNLFFLILAVVAFIGGLYLMGANRKPQEKKNEKAQRRQ
jgi:membrane protein implicated in regulation of membrane protease activity